MAGRIPQTFIEDLLTRIDILDVIDAYVPLRKAGKNHQACCPFHDEKTPSFTVSQEKQFYHCFGCGAHGTVISFLMEYSNMAFPEAVEDLAKRCGLAIPQEEAYTAAANENAALHELLELIIQYYKTQLREHAHASHAVAYLKQRGISGEIAAAYELGYAPPGWDNLLQHLGTSEQAQERLALAGMIIAREQGEGYYDRFRERIMYPIRDHRGRAIGFGGRLLGDGTPKYLNSPETPVYHKSRELYGLHQARQRDKNLARIYVVEGYMDVLAVAQHGIHNAVATLGTAATAEHIERLFRHTSQIVFCFDGDEAGKKAAWRALATSLPQLREGREARFMFMPEGADPDSYVREHGADAFLDTSRYVPLSTFLLDSLTAKTDLSTGEGRARLVDEALPFINKLPRSGFRAVMIEDVASLCQMERQSVDNMLAGLPVEKKRQATRSAQNKPRKTAGRKLIGDIISYLLHQPDLAMHVDEVEALRDMPLAGVNFLIELLDLIHQRPDINCASIIENWRDTAYEGRLHELVTAGADVLEEEGFDLETQFLDALAKLKQKQQYQQLATDTEKRPSQLSAAEKETIRERISSMKPR